MAAIAAALMAAPSAATAKVDISNVVARPIATGATCANNPAPPVDAPAGAHRDFCVSFDLDGGPNVLGAGDDDLKDLQLALPAGVVGDPTAATRCAPATFEASLCSAGSQVGTVQASAVPLGVSGEIYNLTPATGEPARLGIQLRALGAPLVHLQSPVRVRLADAGLTSTTKDSPNTALGLPLSITRMSLDLWGPDTAGRSLSKPFITLPTRCDTPATTTVDVVSYAGAHTSASAAFTPAGCERVPFTPSLEISPTEVPSDQPGESSATLVVPAGDTTGADGIARRQAYPRRVALQLPPGIAINPPMADGLAPCTDQQFGRTVDATPQCPASSEIGRVSFSTPLFDAPLTGKVYFGTPRPGQLLRNFVSVEDPRLRLKLVGDVSVDPASGAILNVFDDSPQVPFTRFQFTYNGGPRAVLTGPTTCDATRTVVAPLTPWTGGLTQSPTAAFRTIDCPPPAFTPSLGATVSDARAGAGTALTVHIERPDRQLRLQRMAVSLPPGLTGRLPAVPACAVADARRAACPAASRVGSARVAVGTGPAPLSLPGDVYLTDGFDGAIAGLAIVVPARVPALDLGTVVTLARLQLRPDTGIDVVTDDLPQAVAGIPTAYRSIDLTIDRAGFLRNATSCAAQALHATFTAVGGATASSDAPYAATGCDALAFAPRLSATLGAAGEVAKGGHPPLDVVIEQGDGEAAMRRAAVTLPSGLAVDLARLKTTCARDAFAAGACPAAARIGSVSAETPLLPAALSGGAFLLASATKGGLPGLGLDLGLLRLAGAVAIAKDGRLTTTFDGIPDVPLRRLELRLAGGTAGVLATGVDLCASEPALEAAFTSQSGAGVPARVAPALAGCAPLTATGDLSHVARRHGRAARPALRLQLVSTAALREVRVTLPAALRPVSAQALARLGRIVAGGRRVSGARVTSKGATLSFTPPAGVRTLELTLPTGALKLAKPLRPGSTVTIAVTGVDAGGAARAAMARVRAKA